MTTPTAANKTATKSAPAKATPAKVEPTNTVAEDKVAVETETTETNRVPEVLSSNSILADFCKRYLDVLDEIADYNKAVLAERDSEWTAAKVMEKAREFGRPTDANVKPKDNVKSALDKFENLVTELAKARKALLDVTSSELGITLSATAERNPELEAPLKEKRKFAVEIGSQLSMIAKMTTDENASTAVEEFLGKNPLPAIGRDQARTFGTDGKSTPKYRVTVKVYDKDGTEKLSEDGFTKTALALTKLYERGKAPKSDALREVWEKAGNTSDKTVQSPVEFTDNDLRFVITKK
jgi:hypothetical protein